MKKLRTHFEQVPVPVVAKLLPREESQSFVEKKSDNGFAGTNPRRRPNRGDEKARWSMTEKDDLKNKSSARWQILCEQAAKEENPERLMALVREIIQEFDERRKGQAKGDAA